MGPAFLLQFEVKTNNVDYNCDPRLFQRRALRALIILNRMRAFVQSIKEI